jgi:hypothetical protein
MDEGAGVYYQKQSPVHLIANASVGNKVICVVPNMPEAMHPV